MKWFIVMCMFLSGCATSLTHQDLLTAKGQVVILDQWFVNTTVEDSFHKHKGYYHKGVALEVANPRLVDVFVKTTCEYIDDGELFGTSDEVMVEAGMKRTIMVRGLLREGDGSVWRLKCVLVSR